MGDYSRASNPGAGTSHNFVIPKKSKFRNDPTIPALPLLQDLAVHDAAFQSDVAAPFYENLRLSALRAGARLSNARRVNNMLLAERFCIRQTQLRRRGIPSDISYVFLQLDASDSSEEEFLCTKGIYCGYSAYDELAPPDSGVVLSAHPDCCTPTAYYERTRLRILIFKILKGRTKLVQLKTGQPAAQQRLDPNFQSVVAQKPAEAMTSESPTHRFRQSQIFLYEYNERGVLVDIPTSILPWAVVTVSFNTPGLGLRNPLTMCERNVILWAGTLKFGDHDVENVEMLSFIRDNIKPPGFHSVLEVNNLLPLSQCLTFPPIRRLMLALDPLLSSKRAVHLNVPCNASGEPTPLSRSGAPTVGNCVQRYSISYYTLNQQSSPLFRRFHNTLRRGQLVGISFLPNGDFAFLLPNGESVSLFGLPYDHEHPVLHALFVTKGPIRFEEYSVGGGDGDQLTALLLRDAPRPEEKLDFSDKVILNAVSEFNEAADIRIVAPHRPPQPLMASTSAYGGFTTGAFTPPSANTAAAAPLTLPPPPPAFFQSMMAQMGIVPPHFMVPPPMFPNTAGPTRQPLLKNPPPTAVQFPTTDASVERRPHTPSTVTSLSTAKHKNGEQKKNGSDEMKKNANFRTMPSTNDNRQKNKSLIQQTLANIRNVGKSSSSPTFGSSELEIVCQNASSSADPQHQEQRPLSKAPTNQHINDPRLSSRDPRLMRTAAVVDPRFQRPMDPRTLKSTLASSSPAAAKSLNGSSSNGVAEVIDADSAGSSGSRPYSPSQETASMSPVPMDIDEDEEEESDVCPPPLPDVRTTSASPPPFLVLPVVTVTKEIADVKKRKEEQHDDDFGKKNRAGNGAGENSISGCTFGASLINDSSLLFNDTNFSSLFKDNFVASTPKSSGLVLPRSVAKRTQNAGGFNFDFLNWGSSSEEQLSSCSKGGDSATLVDAGKEGKAGCSDESNADRKRNGDVLEAESDDEECQQLKIADDTTDENNSFNTSRNDAEEREEIASCPRSPTVSSSTNKTDLIREIPLEREESVTAGVTSSEEAAGGGINEQRNQSPVDEKPTLTGPSDCTSLLAAHGGDNSSRKESMDWLANIPLPERQQQQVTKPGGNEMKPVPLTKVPVIVPSSVPRLGRPSSESAEDCDWRGVLWSGRAGGGNVPPLRQFQSFGVPQPVPPPANFRIPPLCGGVSKRGHVNAPPPPMDACGPRTFFREPTNNRVHPFRSIPPLRASWIPPPGVVERPCLKTPVTTAASSTATCDSRPESQKQTQDGVGKP